MSELVALLAAHAAARCSLASAEIAAVHLREVGMGLTAQGLVTDLRATVGYLERRIARFGAALASADHETADQVRAVLETA